MAKTTTPERKTKESGRTRADSKGARGARKRRDSTAETVRARVLRSQNRFWAVEEFEGSPDAVNAELRRLVRQGELEHLRRGVYWRGAKSRFGMALPRTGSALRRVLGDKEAVGAAEWYATNLLGLSTQVSPTEVLAVSRRPPKGFDQVRLVNRAMRTGRRDYKLNDLEVTILEALEGWDRYVEASPGEALARFVELIRSDEVRVERLVHASKTESAAVRERLRAVLINAGENKLARKITRARSESARRRALNVLRSAASARS